MKVGQFIQTTDIRAVYCLDIHKVYPIMGLYEGDNSVFVMNKRGSIFGLRETIDYTYDESLNAQLVQMIEDKKKEVKIIWDEKKTERIEETQYKLQAGDIVEVLQTEFVYQYGVRRKVIVNDVDEFGHAYVIMPDKSLMVLYAPGDYKRRGTSKKEFDTFWQRRMDKIRERDEQIERMKLKYAQKKSDK